MQIFPLLLQFALLLFAVALSIYLWTIHHALAAIVLSLTALGFILYAVMVISTLWSPDSPFQTPLTALLAVVIKFILSSQSLAQTSAETLFKALAVLCGSLGEALSTPFPRSFPIPIHLPPNRLPRNLWASSIKSLHLPRRHLP
ncbi:hypothetical protein DFH09DRAFT_565110 [Mycena vulgaris]|nr:hypothetical protein DFH09DRAFT_565110 [Mycena vulgaris]